jgi:hypothetical protein
VAWSTCRPDGSTSRHTAPELPLSATDGAPAIDGDDRHDAELATDAPSSEWVGASRPQAPGQRGVGGDRELLGAVAQAIEVAGRDPARARVRRLADHDPVELERVPDRLVDLEADLLSVEHERRGRRGQLRRGQQLRGGCAGGAGHPVSGAWPGRPDGGGGGRDRSS